jgi:two-component system OmpR family response regulator
VAIFSQRSGSGRDTASVSKHSPRVALVEDEAPVREAVERALRREGITVTAFADYPGPDLVLGTAPDLAVLDVLLPNGDGFELARKLRAARDLPIVFLTARDTVEDRLGGFALGADDYLVKPFALEELLARVRAVLRRTGRLGGAIEAGEVVVDEQAALATRAGSPLELTPTELRLLAYLVRQRGMVLSKHQLLTQVWGYDAYDPNVVEVHVSALRRKLEAHGPRILETVRGLGYRFDPR